MCEKSNYNRNEDILQGPTFWKDMNNNDVDGGDLQIALIPLQPDELTDTENFDENNLQREEVQDVAGTLELFISNICDESELNSDDEPLAMKKRRISKMKENRKAYINMTRKITQYLGKHKRHRIG